MKKIFAMLLVAVMIATVVLSQPLEASAESLYIRKIVSVVYDDSGSMSNSSSNDRYVYANYAMQAFCGMLNSEDQLYITYMNDIFKRDSENRVIKDGLLPVVNENYQPSRVDLSAGGIQASIDAIRSHGHRGEYTPYAAVELAMAKLRSVQDSNPNTQYWLVVISDGDFNGSYEKIDQNDLNVKMTAFTREQMPNGTNPQVSYFAIGDSALRPTENVKKGVYSYYAADEASVVSEMSKIADRVSGRTRLNGAEIKKVDDKTIQVTSAIPLLNIAVLLQQSDAKVVNAAYAGENSIPISRKASLGYEATSINPGGKHISMNGSAFLIGDSSNVISAGTYNITFDKPVSTSDVVVLYEPALETRMSIQVNGKEVKNFAELYDTMAGDKISISCKVYEMGTDNVVDPSLLPPGTKYSLSLKENGQVVQQSNEQGMSLVDYELKNVDTELTAAVTIEGFNAIEYTVKFTPTPYVPKVVYTLQPSFGSSVKSVKYDDIASNQELSVCFTVLADGVPMTDVNAVKALNPTINVSPAGNAGAITYTSDGKIVFTPNAASMPAGGVDSFKVDVTCSLADGVTASESYTVLIASYEIFAQNGAKPVIKTQLFDNQESVSFYITKDGVRLGKADVENQFTVELNEAHSKLKTKVSIAEDGLITITPYDENEWNCFWLFRWIDYLFVIPGDDIQVTLSHSFGTASATLDVVEEDFLYILLNVIIPIFLEIVFIIWLVLVITKPRFVPGAKIYAGTLRYDSYRKRHVIENFGVCDLTEFNRIFPLSNGRLKFKKKADYVSANGISIRADHKGRVICEDTGAWYKDSITPVRRDYTNVTTPAAVAAHMDTHDYMLEIAEISPTRTVDANREKVLTPNSANSSNFLIIPAENPLPTLNNREYINEGTIFVYVKD